MAELALFLVAYSISFTIIKLKIIISYSFPRELLINKLSDNIFLYEIH